MNYLKKKQDPEEDLDQSIRIIQNSKSTIDTKGDLKSSFYNVDVETRVTKQNKGKGHKRNMTQIFVKKIENAYNFYSSESSEESRRVNQVKSMNFLSKQGKDTQMNKKIIKRMKSTDYIKTAKMRKTASLNIPMGISLTLSNLVEEDGAYGVPPRNIKHSKSPSVKANIIKFNRDNPFGFTPYDSGRLNNNYGFQEEVIKVLTEVDEESRLRDTEFGY
mmetsp:Transcript_7841/g.8974  ORF Transcript_7841/g.8974 Transcript_7841/m.8974 type:complete len:218 (+) Transcript_7841:46-699(+)